MSQKTRPRKNSPGDEQALFKMLLEFYWEILKDTDLKPSDRIASAKRLEALLTEGKDGETQMVTVTLNLPEGLVKRGDK